MDFKQFSLFSLLWNALTKDYIPNKEHSFFGKLNPNQFNLLIFLSQRSFKATNGLCEDFCSKKEIEELSLLGYIRIERSGKNLLHSISVKGREFIESKANLFIINLGRIDHQFNFINNEKR